MKTNKKISRKKFFNKTISFLTIPFYFLMIGGVKREKEISKQKKIIVPSDISDGVSFFDKVIVKKMGSEITVFSSACTHLGCRIINEINGQLVCPCHGSKFDLEGFAITGPAVEPLRKLRVFKDPKTGEIFVNA